MPISTLNSRLVLIQRFLFWLLTALLILPGAEARAARASELLVETTKTHQSISSHFQYLPHREGLTAERAIHLPDQQWQATDAHIVNFLSTAKPYWFRTNIVNSSPQELERLIEFKRPTFNTISVHIYRHGELTESYSLGRVRRAGSLPFKNNSFLMPITLPANSKIQVLVYTSSQGFPFQFSSTLWQVHEYYADRQLSDAFNIFIFGAGLSLTLYNLFLFFSTRALPYLYYSLYALSFIYAVASMGGYTQIYLWPDSPNTNLVLHLVSNHLYRFSIYLFSIKFLNMAYHLPRWVWVLRILMLIELLSMLINTLFLVFEQYEILAIVISLITELSLIQLPICLSTGAYLLWKGVKEARFYTIAWISLSLGLFHYSLNLNGWIAYNEYALPLLQFTQVIEMLLFSLALADRLNILRANQKRLLEAEQKALHSADASVAMKNAFLTAISHELRTPMNAILGGLQVAQQYPLEHLKPPLDIVQGGASEMMRLIDDILRYTEIQSGQMSINEDNTNIKVLLSELRDLYQHNCEKKKLRLDWEYEEPIPDWLKLDQEKFITVLSKLLDNAIMYTTSGFVRLRVRCKPVTESEPPSYQISCDVEDSGIGINPEDQAQIYDAFHQVEHGFQRGFGGLGIGLAICQQLLAALEGELSLLSSSRKGSAFTFFIPATIGSVPSDKKAPKLASSSLPILVVEDNVTNQLVMEKLLKKMGYYALIANHGKEALALLETDKFSLILMDLQMPVMDGFVCTEAIRKRKDDVKDIPIVAVTANLMDVDKEQCIRSGMNDYLEKPVHLGNLRNILSQYLEPALSENEHDE